MKRIAGWVAAALAILIGLAFVLGNPVRWAESSLIMWDIAAGGGFSPWQEVTATPSMQPRRWSDGEGDLYLPGGRVRAAMVLVPGADVLGRDEPRLQAFAKTFARAGFVVLIPELPEVRQLRLSRADADRVASALRQLHQWQPGVPLGVAAISYAVGPAIIAALEDDVAPTVDFIAGVGGYRDTETVIRFVTTGVFRPSGSAREFHIEPNAYGRWAFLFANASRLDDAENGRRLEDIAQMHFRDPVADTSRIAAGLGPQGRSVLMLVENRDADAVGRLIAALPPGIRKEIDGLDLALYDLSKLRGHLILVHGRGDPMVPYSESEALAAAASKARVSLFLIDDIGHVEFNAVSAANGWTMVRAIASLLEERR
jgi:fermentation-respiration switch protein FrsA (DUF1100 family)